MAYGRDSAKFMLKEGKFKIGTWSSPSAIVSTSDPLNEWTETGDIGYFERGSISFEVPRSYAQFDAGTPFEKVRKDLVGKEFMVNLSLAQWNEDLSALVWGADTDTGGNYKITWLGFDEPTSASNTNGFLLETALTDGTPFFIGMFAGRATSEDLGMEFSGDSHVTYPLKLEAFKHSDFGTTSTDDQRGYGIIWRDET